MTRTDLDPINEDDIKQASGLEWDIDLAEYNMSKATRRLYFTDSISQSGEFELDVVVDPGDIQSADPIKVSKKGVGAFYGIVKQPESSSQGGDMISGGGASEILRDVPITAEYIGFSSVDVVNDVFSNITSTQIKVGTNEELTTGSGSIDARAEDEGALTFLNRVIQSHGGEWYVSYDSTNDVFEFNVVEKLESSSVVKTFTENNTKEIKDVPVVDETYDAVVVRGYGDGEDQVQGVYPDRSSWPDDPRVLRYTDKTILSDSQASTTAEEVYNKHSDWRSIFVYPSSHQTLLNLGDKVEVNEPRSGVNGEFRVVARTLNLDFRGDRQVEYVLSDKPIGIIDEAEDVKEQTDSQTDYMQGSRNVWGEKETRNCSDTRPLVLDIEVPQDVVDKTGESKIQSISANYKASAYKEDGNPVSTATLQTENIDKDTRVRKINLDKNDKTDSVDSGDLSGSNRSSTESLDSDAVEVEKSDISDHNHGVASSTADQNFIEQDIITTFSSSNTVTLNEGQTADLPITLQDEPNAPYVVDSDPFFITTQISESANSPGNQVAIKGDVQTDLFSDTFVNTGISTGVNGDIKISNPVDTPSALGEVQEINYEIYNIPDGSGPIDISVFGRVYAAKKHDHDIPEQSGGTDTGAKDEPVSFEKKNPAIGETSNFKSTGITVNEAEDYVIEITDNQNSTADDASPTEPSTVEDLTDEEVFRVSDIESEVSEDANFVASEVTVSVEDPDGNVSQVGTWAQTEKTEINLNDYITGPGNYKVEFEPDTLTHLKSRVFLDHHKDAS